MTRLLLLIVALATTLAAAAAPPPAIRVDARHDASTGRRVEYRVPPARSLVVDTTGYAWHIPSVLQRRGIKHPTHVNVLIDRDHGYLVRWKPGRMVLDARSMKPMAGRKPFAGLQPGQKIVVGVGIAVRSRGRTRFLPFWAGVVNVR